jgi:hypothetical protein
MAATIEEITRADFALCPIVNRRFDSFDQHQAAGYLGIGSPEAAAHRVLAQNWRATNDDDEQYCFAVAL